MPHAELLELIVDGLTAMVDVPEDKDGKPNRGCLILLLILVLGAVVVYFLTR